MRWLVLLGAGLVLASTVVWSWYWAHRAPRNLATASLLRVDKSERSLELLRGDQVIARYRVSLGANASGHKQREGDERTPEGRYVLDNRNSRSRFHKSLHISYPNSTDRSRAGKAGVSPGGDIMLHGMMNGFDWAAPLLRWLDWTDGCIAVDDVAMEEIWRAVPNGTPIEITP